MSTSKNEAQLTTYARGHVTYSTKVTLEPTATGCQWLLWWMPPGKQVEEIRCVLGLDEDGARSRIVEMARQERARVGR